MIFAKISTRTRYLLISLLAVIVPSVIVYGLFTLLNSTQSDAPSSLDVAVVNKDRTVKNGDSDLNMGNQVVAELKQNKDVQWHFVSAKQAAKQLAADKVLMTVTLPSDFSANSLTALSAHPKESVIKYRVSEKANYVGGMLANSIAAQLKNQVTAKVQKAYNKELLASIKQLSNGTKSVASGVQQLKTGFGPLQDGSNTINTNMHKLASGMNEIQNGVAALPAGVTQLSNGAGQLAAGTNQLADNTPALAAGAKQLQDGAVSLDSNMPNLVSGAKAATDGAQQIATGNTQLVAGLQQMATTIETSQTASADQLKQLTAGLSQLNEQLVKPATATVSNETVTATATALKTQLDSMGSNVTAMATFIKTLSAVQAANPDLTLDQALNSAPLKAAYTAAQAATTDSALAQMQTGIKQLEAAVPLLASAQSGQLYTLSAGSLTAIQQLSAGLAVVDTALQKGDATQSQPALIAAAQQLATGSKKLATNMPMLSNGILQVQGATAQLATGTTQLTSGANQLNVGAVQLNTGANQLAAGINQLGTQMPTLIDGIQAATTGANQLASGGDTFNAGLSTANAGVTKLNSALQAGVTELQPISLKSETIHHFVSPVTADAQNVSKLTDYKSIFGPLLISFALFVGAIIMQMNEHRRRGNTSVNAMLRMFIGLPALQAILVAGIVALFGVHVTNWVGFVGLSMLAAVAFAFVALALDTLFGTFGLLLSFVVAIAQIVLTGQLVPNEMLNSMLLVIQKVLPMTYANEGFAVVMHHTDSASVGTALVGLVVFGSIAALVVFGPKLALLNKTNTVATNSN